jgi:hypothetical protein
MPSSSAKQHKFMEAVAHNPAFAKKVGVPQSVGKDFSTADKGKTFKRGGEMATKMDPKMMAMMAAKKRGAGMGAMAAPAAPAGGMGMMKKGGMTKKMAAGGLSSGHKSADGVASKGKTKGKDISMPGNKGMKKGGKV